MTREERRNLLKTDFWEIVEALQEGTNCQERTYWFALADAASESDPGRAGTRDNPLATALRCVAAADVRRATAVEWLSLQAARVTLVMMSGFFWFPSMHGLHDLASRCLWRCEPARLVVERRGRRTTIGPHEETDDGWDLVGWIRFSEMRYTSYYHPWDRYDLFLSHPHLMTMEPLFTEADMDNSIAAIRRRQGRNP